MDEIGFLHREAQECRRAANDLSDSEARRGLQQLAKHYEQEARRLNVVELRGRN